MNKQDFWETVTGELIATSLFGWWLSWILPNVGGRDIGFLWSWLIMLGLAILVPIKLKPLITFTFFVLTCIIWVF